MNILSNLVENCGDYESSSLLLCLSPKSQTASEKPKERLSSCVAKKTSTYLERSSKSLTKMNLFSNLAKIDPKERLLHRLTYKLEGKVKKHYYNFFIKLENFKKNAQKEAVNKVKEVEKEKKKIQSRKLQSAVEKLNQVNSILFSKYFENSAKKNVFTLLKYMGRYQLGLKKIFALFE